MYTGSTCPHPPAAAQRSTHIFTTGEDAEFTALVQRQSRFVFRVAYAVLLNAHDAEDAVQETFLKLYRNRGWHNLQNERAFLARVAWRVAADLRSRFLSSRSAPPSIWLDGDDPQPSFADQRPTPEPGPEQTLLAANHHAIVHSMIDALPEDLHLPLVLSSFEALNSREIAGILSIPEGTVRTRLQRARQFLRQKLATLQPQEAHHA